MTEIGERNISWGMLQTTLNFPELCFPKLNLRSMGMLKY